MRIYGCTSMRRGGQLLLNAPVAIINDVISVFSPEANMKEAGFIILTPLKTLHTPGKAEV
jgi:hypothetical protein